MGINKNEIHQKNIFLPTLCRFSIKDVNVHTIPIAAADPSSPKVSCIGKVKRSNRVAAAGTTTTIISAPTHPKYTKSKSFHLFSKTLLPNPTTMSSAVKVAGGGGSRSCRTNREVGLNSVRRSRVRTHSCDQELDISEMDPPLPVVKRAAAAPGIGRDEMNIWKRRSNGGKLLQIEPIYLPGNKFMPTFSDTEFKIDLYSCTR